jgi:hypothetical protein
VAWTFVFNVITAERGSAEWLLQGVATVALSPSAILHEPVMVNKNADKEEANLRNEKNR